MASDYTVHDLIRELNAAKTRLEDKGPNVAGGLVHMESLARQLSQDAEGSALAQPIFISIQRTKEAVDRALERRYAAHSHLEQYLTAFRSGALMTSGGGSAASAGGGPAAHDRAELTHAQRSEKRKAADGWAWGELAFAGVGIGVSLVGTVVTIATPVSLGIAAGLVVAKLVYTYSTDWRTREDRRAARKEGWATAGDGVVDMGWEIAGALVDVAGLAVPGISLVGDLIDVIGALKSLQELDEIHTEWKKKKRDGT